MASAGRILIMPKGDWSAEAEYEMLDLVKHNGTSWLAKKTVTGIEPSEASGEHWQNMFDVTALSIGALNGTCDKLSYSSSTDTDESNFNAWLNEVMADMPNQSSRNICFLCENVIGSTTYYGTLSKHDESNATLLASTYGNDEKGILHKNKTVGVWQNAKFIALS